jgi:hypothetical protein
MTIKEDPNDPRRQDTRDDVVVTAVPASNSTQARGREPPLCGMPDLYCNKCLHGEFELPLSLSSKRAFVYTFLNGITSSHLIESVLGHSPS